MIWQKIGANKPFHDAMSDKLQFIDFYQLASDETGELVAQLAEKSQMIAKKVIIHASKDSCQRLSRALWEIRDLSFMAHGTDGEDGADYAGIWLSSDEAKNHISAEFAILTEGRMVTDLTAFERCFIVFNGKDEAALGQARSQWQTLSQNFKGKCRYFAKSDEGKWEQKATG